MFSCFKDLKVIGLVAVLILVQIILIISAYGESGIQLNLDVAQFQNVDKSSYIEIYYSLPEYRKMYTADGPDKFSCQLVVDLQIFQDHSLWASKIWKIEKTVEDTNEIKQKSQMADLIRYQVDKPASYRIIIHTKDLNHPDQIDSMSTEIVCREFTQNKLEISDLELASKIKRAPPGTRSVLLKNVYEITPNPGGLYGEGAAVIYYYFEAYNLMENIPGPEYATLCQVKDSNNRTVKGLGRSHRTKKKIHDSSVEMGMLNISKLPSGKYTLVYGIADSSENVIINRSKPFYVYNPGIALADLETEKPTSEEQGYGPLEKLGDKELDAEFARMIYITSREQKLFYDNLTNAAAKRSYIYRAWQLLGTKYGGTTGLVYREDYLARVQTADKMFKSVFKKGWKSDRGRVFILYGAPSNVDRFPSTERTVPYEMWKYDYLRRQPGVLFVFSDHVGFNKYELIHSSLRGELQEQNWRQMINRGSGASPIY